MDAPIDSRASATARGQARATCPVCEGTTVAEASLFDDRYGHPGSYGLWRCCACGHRKLDAQMDGRQIADLYTRYYPRASFDVEAWSLPRERSGLVTWWQGLRASAFLWVPRDVRVLDIGCGFAEALGYHRARGCEVHGVEADSNVARVAQRHGLDIRVGVFDASQYDADSFDVVTMDQVIEHVSAPLDVLRGVARVLKPGGLLIISTPNVEGWGARAFGWRWVHWHAPYHQQFFSRWSMLDAVTRTGYVLTSRTTVTNSAWLGFQWCHLATYPAEGMRSPFWAGAADRSFSQRWILRLLAVFNRLGVNAAITRLADAIGQGDNCVYVLRKASR